MIKNIYFLIPALCFSTLSFSQESDSLKRPFTIYEAVIIDGDTIPVITLDVTEISARRTLKSQRFQRRYGRIKRKILKTYPYAKITKALLEKYQTELDSIDQEKRKKDYLKIAEKELKEEFEGEIRNLTISEGRILIKLIDRETGKTSFELVKELKGNFSAFMWQSVARMFGSNLKSQYDSQGEDAIIEEIVQAIERGEIIVPNREPKTTKAQMRLKRKEKRTARKNAQK